MNRLYSYSLQKLFKKDVGVFIEIKLFIVMKWLLI